MAARLDLPTPETPSIAMRRPTDISSHQGRQRVMGSTAKAHLRCLILAQVVGRAGSSCGYESIGSQIVCSGGTPDSGLVEVWRHGDQQNQCGSHVIPRVPDRSARSDRQVASGVALRNTYRASHSRSWIAREG